MEKGERFADRIAQDREKRQYQRDNYQTESDEGSNIYYSTDEDDSSLSG